MNHGLQYFLQKKAQHHHFFSILHFIKFISFRDIKKFYFGILSREGGGGDTCNSIKNLVLKAEHSEIKLSGGRSNFEAKKKIKSI